MTIESGWFASLEMTESMANTLLQVKMQKYAARLEKKQGGKCVVYWRGLTYKEKVERAQQKKMAKGIN